MFEETVTSKNGVVKRVVANSQEELDAAVKAVKDEQNDQAPDIRDPRDGNKIVSPDNRHTEAPYQQPEPVSTEPNAEEQGAKNEVRKAEERKSEDKSASESSESSSAQNEASVTESKAEPKVSKSVSKESSQGNSKKK